MSVTSSGPGTTPGPTAVVIEIERDSPAHGCARTVDISPGNGADVTVSRVVLYGDVRRVFGWSIVETTGAAGASWALHDGTTADGPIIAYGHAANGATDSPVIPDRGIEVKTGKLYLSVSAGSIAGVIYYN